MIVSRLSIFAAIGLSLLVFATPPGGHAVAGAFADVELRGVEPGLSLGHIRRHEMPQRRKHCSSTRSHEPHASRGVPGIQTMLATLQANVGVQSSLLDGKRNPDAPLKAIAAAINASTTMVTAGGVLAPVLPADISASAAAVIHLWTTIAVAMTKYNAGAILTQAATVDSGLSLFLNAFTTLIPSSLNTLQNGVESQMATIVAADLYLSLGAVDM